MEVLIGQSPISMVHFPASHVGLPEGKQRCMGLTENAKEDTRRYNRLLMKYSSNVKDTLFG